MHDALLVREVQPAGALDDDLERQGRGQGPALAEDDVERRALEALHDEVWRAIELGRRPRVVYLEDARMAKTSADARLAEEAGEARGLGCGARKEELDRFLAAHAGRVSIS